MNVDDLIQEVNIPSVYEYLMKVDRTDRSFADCAVLISEFSVIDPSDARWQEVVMKCGSKAAILIDQGMKVIGIAKNGECIGCCGYKVTAPEIIIRGKHVELPYKLFLAVDKKETGAALVYSVQMAIAPREDLKIVQQAA